MSNSVEIEKEKSVKRRREEEGGSEKRSKSTGFEPPKQALKEEKGGGGDASRGSSSFDAVGDRQRFTVELRPGETTIVSWRKLAKDASKLKGPTSVPEPPPSTAHPVLESRIGPGKPSEKELKDETAPHRFSAVIEKIERLYMGKGSSDEEDLNDLPDDNQYDTEDSFIDDAELDEYFEVDNSTTKHNGFFVNRGKLERINEAALPNQQMKKRRRKDMLKIDGESDMHAPHKLAKLAKKTADQLVEVAPVVGNSSNLSRGVASKSDKVDDVKAPNQLNASVVCTKKKPSDTRTLDPSISLKGSNGVVSVSLSEAKHNEKLKVGSHQLKHVGSKLKDARVSDDSHQKFHERSSHTQVKYKSGKQFSVTDEQEIAVRTKENSGVRELPDLNIPEVKYPTQTTKTHSVHRKEGSGTRPKSSMLDKAIKELEKSVTESRPPNLDVQDADTSSQNVKRRLPREIKQKLSKVARLASTNGKMSKELINRLDKILGHLVQLRTLKRNLKIMINSSLSAKQEKDNRFQQIKKEVAEIIKMQFPSPKSKVSNQVLGASDDFQETGIEEKTVMKKKFSMDSVMEDKICDLYDLYVDGLDEDSGPQIRKLYAELAEMWPNGYIDNHGIKRAICRAKDRRKALYNQHKDLEKNDRKLLARVEASSVAQPQQVRERLPSDHGNHGVASSNRPISGITTTTTTAALRVPSPTVSGPYVERPKPERMKGSLATSQSDGKLTEGTLIKKKVKRKPEHGVGEGQFRHEKSLSAPNQDRSYKQAVLLKPNVQSAPPSAEQ